MHIEQMPGAFNFKTSGIFFPNLRLSSAYSFSSIKSGICPICPVQCPVQRRPLSDIICHIQISLHIPFRKEFFPKVHITLRFQSFYVHFFYYRHSHGVPGQFFHLIYFTIILVFPVIVNKLLIRGPVCTFADSKSAHAADYFAVSCALSIKSPAMKCFQETSGPVLCL